MFSSRRVLLLMFCALVGVGSARGADWPQFRGPNRDGLSKETGLLKSWPKDGPEKVWAVTGLGMGFGTPSVAEGKIYGLGTRDGKDGVWALNEADGKEQWFTPFDEPRKTNQNNGPSSTPTVLGGKAYALSSKGKLVCLDAKTGELEWQADFVKDFGGSVPGWGYTESPLIDGDKLICTPGGKTPLVALDKSTGKVIWKAAFPKAEGAHYASAITVESAGQKQYIQFVRSGVVAVGASDGAFLWRYSAPANGTANCSTPIFHDGHVFAASAYGTGGGLAKVAKEGEKFEATEVYFEKRLQNHHGGMVLVDGFLYGEGSGKLTCTNFLTGEVVWSEPKVSKGSVTFADGLLYCRAEGGKGTIVLAEANPKKFVEKGRFDQPDRTKLNAWAHPVVANGKLYIRDQELLLCYNVKAK
ncbi:MAG TPA: PQQ-binding-like beta-propeller repeat protein [Gemmata sp.]